MSCISPTSVFPMSCISPFLRFSKSTTFDAYSSGTWTSTASYGSCFLPSSPVLMMTSGGPISSSKPSLRIVSMSTVKWRGPRPDTVKASPESCGSTCNATFLSNSFISRSRITREVNLSPSLPARGDLLTAKDIETVGSSTAKQGNGWGSAFSVTVSPIWMSETPENMTISPADASSTAFRPRLSYTNKSLILIALAISGKKVGFEKVITMIDEMVANLKKEQIDDDNKKEYCEKQFDISEDKKKELEMSVSDSETAIDEMEGSIEKLTEEIASLTKGIKKLDKSVADATEQRKEENAEYKELKQSDTAAKEILLFAKNRLNKFYAPKLYKPELLQESEVYIQVSAHTKREAPPAPPETFGAYTKKSEDNAGVTQMIDLLVKDLDKELQEAEVMEKDAQEDYEALMVESATKRADDSKSISDKTSTKASQEEALEKEEDTKAATGKELMATLEYIHSLHGECDWLLKYFDARKEARDGEIDALGKAKAVLSGADFSLMQTGRSLRGWF